MGRCEQHFHVANTTFANLGHIPGVDESDKLKINFEEAQLFWAKNDKRRGLSILKQLLNLEDDHPKYISKEFLCYSVVTFCLIRIRSSSLKLYGKWVAEMHSISPQNIISDYFLKSIHVAVNAPEHCRNEDDIIDTYHILAKFADKEYQQV